MPLPYKLPAPVPGGLVATFAQGADSVTFTTAGLALLATAWQTNGAAVAPLYAALATGLGTLSSSLNYGAGPYTSFDLIAGVSSALAVGQSLTLIDSSGDTAAVTVAYPGARVGDTTIPIQSFTPAVSFGLGSGCTLTPAATDLAMVNEAYRIALPADAVVPGATPGESILTAYFDPSLTPTGFYVEMGLWGGSTASAALGSGVLLARVLPGAWQHIQGINSATLTLDWTISLA